MPYNIRRTKLILSVYALENNEILEDGNFNLVVQNSIRADWKKSFQNWKTLNYYKKF